MIQMTIRSKGKSVGLYGEYEPLYPKDLSATSQCADTLKGGSLPLFQNNGAGAVVDAGDDRGAHLVQIHGEYGGDTMRKMFVVGFILLSLFSVSFAWAGIPEDLASKKPLTEVFQNALTAGLAWDQIVYEAIKAGADPTETIITALNMGADPQLVQKGSKQAGTSDQTIRNAFARAQESGGGYGGRGGVAPLMPIAPNYSSGGGGGGTPGSPSR